MFVMNYLKNERVSPQHQLKKYYPEIFERLKIKQFEKMHSSVENSLKTGESILGYLEQILTLTLFQECILMV